jgi:hypothetical protein
MRIYTNKTFIQKANTIHNYIWSYENIEYKGIHIKLCITCKIHGYFWQQPNAHLRGQGCPICGHQKKNTMSFIAAAKLVHKEQYQYKNTIYIHNKKKIKITCNIHGDFNQTPNSHLSGQGCPKCSLSKNEIRIREILESLPCKYQTQYKISTCCDKRPLPFDFAIFNNLTLIGLIEFQGKQHYVPCSFGSKHKSAIELFNECKLRDIIKKEYCIKTNIPLLEIPYWEKSNIPKLIKKFIQYTK